MDPNATLGWGVAWGLFCLVTILFTIFYTKSVREHDDFGDQAFVFGVLGLIIAGTGGGCAYCLACYFGG